MKFKKILRVISFILLFWIVLHICYSIVDGLTDKGEIAAYAVVLGNKVNDDGSLSVRLEKRMECALKLYSQE